MSGQRERRIIEGLLVACLAAGFACFAFILLPEMLAKAGATPPTSLAPTATNLSDVIPLRSTAPRAQASETLGTAVARFVPEALPADPYAPARSTTPPPSAPIDENEPAAGGAGAAIDDQTAESLLAFQRRVSNEADQGAAAGVLPAGTAAAGDALGQPPDAAVLVAPPGGRPELHELRATSLAFKPKASSEGSRRKGENLPPWLAIPPELAPDVAFWRDIYTRYDRNQVVLHHPRLLGIVYEVVDLSDIEADPRLTDVERAHQREQRVEQHRQAIAEILRKLSTNPAATSLTEEEWRVRKLFEGIAEPDAFRRASSEDGVRAQLGQKDKFLAGLAFSGRYLGEIESIFATYGLPKELTRLIFVESMFNPRARSSVGASGIWQFMRGTGKLYLRINDMVDERNDPILATHAAAKLLRRNYESLGTWPLAINAYNAGRGRLEQAVARLGTTDIGRIVREFSHPDYGFASRNFFPEFLAAADVAEHAERFFGPIAFDPPLRYESVRAPYHLSLPDVARVASIPIEDIADLNPAFTPAILEGRLLLPAGFEVRVPERKGELFLAAAARAPRSRTGALHHVVEEGESLLSIADAYGVTPAAIVQANREMGRSVHRGQTLVIPWSGRP
jgi:peptidoglycan lytic transglycosylase D